MRHNSVIEMIHNTPMLELLIGRRLGQQIFLKLEAANPSGSMKDRIALHCIEAAERGGLLKKGCSILESTSGSLGVSLAMVGALKGYRVICVVDPKITRANCTLMKLFGATVISVDQPDAVGNFLTARLAKVAELMAKDELIWWFDQYENPDNPGAHYEHTAREIFQDMQGDVDWIVCPVGTGGLAAGIATFFKEHLPSCRIMAVDAVGSVVLKGVPGDRRQVGIGSSRASSHLEFSLLDDLVYVNDAEAFDCCRLLASKEGLCLGGSSGSAVAGLLKRIRGISCGSRIVVVAPDCGLKYIDTIYDGVWSSEVSEVMDDSYLSIIELLSETSRCSVP